MMYDYSMDKNRIFGRLERLEERVSNMEMRSDYDALKAERDLLLAIRDRFVACFEPGDRRSIMSVNFDAVWEAVDALKRGQK